MVRAPRDPSPPFSSRVASSSSSSRDGFHRQPSLRINRHPSSASASASASRSLPALSRVSLPLSTAQHNHIKGLVPRCPLLAGDRARLPNVKDAASHPSQSSLECLHPQLSLPPSYRMALVPSWGQDKGSAGSSPGSPVSGSDASRVVDNASVRVLQAPFFSVASVCRSVFFTLEPRLLAVPLLVEPQQKPGWAGSCVCNSTGDISLTSAFLWQS